MSVDDLTREEQLQEKREAKRKEIEAQRQKAESQNRTKRALELRRSLQLFLSTLDPEVYLDQMLEVPTVFPKYNPAKDYPEGAVVSSGVNNVGDPQLYQVSSTSAIATMSLQEEGTAKTYQLIPLGINDNGIAKWTAPLGKADGYDLDDIVYYNGVQYKSLKNFNLDIPGTNPNSWTEYGGKNV